MFGRKKSPEPAIDLDHESGAEATGKNRPTPKRREAEAARRQPLVPQDRKAAGRRAREAAARQREEARQALITGDERKMPPMDQGPVRRFLRDFVDSRFWIGEIMLPVMLLLVIAMFAVPALLGNANPLAVKMTAYLTPALWGLMLGIGVQTYLRWRQAKGIIAKRFGPDTPLKGSLMYMLRRSTQMRVMRLPKPMVKFGGDPR